MKRFEKQTRWQETKAAAAAASRPRTVFKAHAAIPLYYEEQAIIGRLSQNSVLLRLVDNK